MQKTRQKILEFLKQHGEATVDDLSQALDDLTAVTVRHHLDVLRSQGMIASPEILHRTSPGRPRYVYTLTDKALALFPKNINTFTSHMLSELKHSLDGEQVNVIFEGIATRMASELEPGAADEPFEMRLDRVVVHLTEHGYQAHWEHHPDGYVLHTSNCPYSGVVEDHGDLCTLDMRYISQLLGTVPRRINHMVQGDDACSYLVAEPHVVAVS
jgi:DeoR family transcriptional regulator, suf operon transcriptional repressor